VAPIIGAGLPRVKSDPLLWTRGVSVTYVLRFALIIAYTVFWGVPAMLVAPFSGEAIVWIGRTWLGWIFHACGIRVEAEGLAHIDRTQSYVFMSNHQSVLDIGALVLTLPVSWRFVAKRELTWIPFFGWALGLSDQIVIDRGNRAKAVRSLARAAERVRRGVNVIIFPEGTRSPTGAMREFKSGGFHLAIQAQVPILPTTVSGSHELIPKRSLKVQSGTIKVVYGTPIPTRGMRPEQRDVLKTLVREAITRGYDAALQGAAQSARVSDAGGSTSVSAHPGVRSSA
jgi:1-acyl-sn-glycerol-3-phosphate acyltransferase